MKPRFNITPFNLVTSERIRAVKNNDLDSLITACLHDKTQCTDECIRPHPDVLNIVNHDINAFKHFRGRLAVCTIKRINRQAGRLVD